MHENTRLCNAIAINCPLSWSQLLTSDTMELLGSPGASTEQGNTGRRHLRRKTRHGDISFLMTEEESPNSLPWHLKPLASGHDWSQASWYPLPTSPLWQDPCLLQLQRATAPSTSHPLVSHVSVLLFLLVGKLSITLKTSAPQRWRLPWLLSNIGIMEVPKHTSHVTLRVPHCKTKKGSLLQL